MGDELRGVDHVEVGNRPHSGNCAVDGALLNGGEDVAKRHRHRRNAKPLERHALKWRGKNSDLLALEVLKMTDRASRNELGGLRHEQANAVQASVGTEAQ